MKRIDRFSPSETIKPARASRAGSACAHVLERRSLRQARQALCVCAHVALHRLRIDPGVFAQRPADRLAQEELLALDRRLDAGVQEVEIGLGLTADLAQDRAAALPHVA